MEAATCRQSSENRKDCKSKGKTPTRRPPSREKTTSSHAATTTAHLLHKRIWARTRVEFSRKARKALQKSRPQKRPRKVSSKVEVSGLKGRVS